MDNRIKAQGFFSITHKETTWHSTSKDIEYYLGNLFDSLENEKRFDFVDERGNLVILPWKVLEESYITIYGMDHTK